MSRRNEWARNRHGHTAKAAIHGMAKSQIRSVSMVDIQPMTITGKLNAVAAIQGVH